MEIPMVSVTLRWWRGGTRGVRSHCSHMAENHDCRIRSYQGGARNRCIPSQRYWRHREEQQGDRWRVQTENSSRVLGELGDRHRRPNPDSNRVSSTDKANIVRPISSPTTGLDCRIAHIVGRLWRYRVELHCNDRTGRTGGWIIRWPWLAPHRIWRSARKRSDV